MLPRRPLRARAPEQKAACVTRWTIQASAALEKHADHERYYLNRQLSSIRILVSSARVLLRICVGGVRCFEQYGAAFGDAAGGIAELPG